MTTAESSALVVPEAGALATLPDPETATLALIERGRAAIAEAETLEGAQSVLGQTKILEAATRAVELTKETIVDASELRVRAERRVGELTPKPKPGARRDLDSTPSKVATSGERAQATRARKLAKVPAAKFEQAIRETKTKALNGGGNMTAETVLRTVTPKKKTEKPPDAAANIYQAATSTRWAFHVRDHLDLIAADEIPNLLALAREAHKQWQAVIEALERIQP